MSIYNDANQEMQKNLGIARQEGERKNSGRFDLDKYHAMQSLLRDIADVPETHLFNIADVQQRARDILTGMKIPKGPEDRATERAKELEALASAYRVVHGVEGPPGSRYYRAVTITVEALKAWERAHPPAALDPALLEHSK